MFPVAEYRIVQIDTKCLDYHNARVLKEAVGDLLDKGILNVILDMSQVKEITSVGFETLLTLLQKINQHDGKLKMIGIGRELLSVFRTCLLNQVFDLHLHEGQFQSFDLRTHNLR